jgi:hypothetical protein
LCPGFPYGLAPVFCLGLGQQPQQQQSADDKPVVAAAVAVIAQKEHYFLLMDTAGVAESLREALW